MQMELVSVLWTRGFQIELLQPLSHAIQVCVPSLLGDGGRHLQSRRAFLDNLAVVRYERSKFPSSLSSPDLKSRHPSERSRHRVAGGGSHESDLISSNLGRHTSELVSNPWITGMEMNVCTMAASNVTVASHIIETLATGAWMPFSHWIRSRNLLRIRLSCGGDFVLHRLVGVGGRSN